MMPYIVEQRLKIWMLEQVKAQTGLACWRFHLVLVGLHRADFLYVKLGISRQRGAWFDIQLVGRRGDQRTGRLWRWTDRSLFQLITLQQNQMPLVLGEAF